MDNFNLAAMSEVPELRAAVFNFDEVEDGLNFIQNNLPSKCLVVAGNSRGGQAVVNFANSYERGIN